MEVSRVSGIDTSGSKWSKPRNEVVNANPQSGRGPIGLKRQQMKARVFKYDVEKGFGFLVEENNTRHFFHVTNCQGFVPQVGMVVTFEVGEGRRGPAAINLRLIPVAPVAPDVSAGIEALAAKSAARCGCLGVNHPDCPTHGLGDTSKSAVS